MDTQIHVSNLEAPIESLSKKLLITLKARRLSLDA